jgi:hypothetical protein
MTAFIRSFNAEEVSTALQATLQDLLGLGFTPTNVSVIRPSTFELTSPSEWANRPWQPVTDLQPAQAAIAPVVAAPPSGQPNDGWLRNVLTGYEMPTDTADEYLEGLRGGGALVLVHADFTPASAGGGAGAGVWRRWP